jgi:hypothetical protein
MRRTILAIAILGSGLAVLVALLGVIAVRAQQPRGVGPQGGRRSPHETTSATVGGATLTIVYGRPYTRGREIFGGLVPWNAVWCPGADEATTLESTRPIEVEGLAVPPGPHTIWVLPTPDEWTLIVSKEPSGFHTRYPSRSDLGRVAFARRLLVDPVEQLTFTITPRGTDEGTIAMLWEQTEASVRFRVVE